MGNITFLNASNDPISIELYYLEENSIELKLIAVNKSKVVYYEIYINFK